MEGNEQKLQTNPTDGAKPQDGNAPQPNAPQGKMYTENEFLSEVDRRVSQAVDKVTKKFEAEKSKEREELKAYYAEQAKKSENQSVEEKVQQLLQQHQEDMDKRDRETNIKEARVELKNAGFDDEEEVKFLCDDFVTADRDASLAKINALIKYKKQRDEAQKKKFSEQMSSQFGAGLKTSSNDVNTFEKQYKDAISRGDMAGAIAVQRNAAEKGIKINI